MGAVVISGLIHLLSLAVPALLPVFHTDHTWSATEVAVVVALSLLPVPAVEIAKLLGLTGPRRRPTRA